MADRNHFWLLDILALVCGAALIAAFFWLPRHGNLPRFMAECVEPYLAGKPMQSSCGTKEAIAAAYGIDIEEHIRREWMLMAVTAKRIAAGELTDPQAYKECIRAKKCAPVPLDPSDETHKAAFWDLAESDSLTGPVCDLMPVCKAMTEARVVTHSSFQAAR